MKMRAILASTAIIFSSFVPVLNTSAWAAVTILDTVTPDDADATTLAAMQTQCNTLADAHTGDWTGTLDDSSITPTYVSGPTEVGTHSIADAIGDPVGAGTFTPGTVSILGDPYRNGGSVNMFGVQQATGGHYSASTYDFQGDFTSTYSYAFSCNMSEHVVTLATGHHEWNHDDGNAPPNQAACDAYDNNGLFIGEDNGPCSWVVDTPASEDDVDRDPELGSPINQSQTDSLLAHEDAGEGFDVDETVLIGQTVICISPTISTQTKKGVPGTWVAKNGYIGGKCTTAWFNVAPWGHGSQDSNGTYISVPLS